MSVDVRLCYRQAPSSQKTNKQTSRKVSRRQTKTTLKSNYLKQKFNPANEVWVYSIVGFIHLYIVLIHIRACLPRGYKCIIYCVTIVPWKWSNNQLSGPQKMNWWNEMTIYNRLIIKAKMLLLLYMFIIIVKWIIEGFYNESDNFRTALSNLVNCNGNHYFLHLID